MMLMETTPSEPTGTPHTKKDIIFETISFVKTRLKSLTPEGYLWIRQNMLHDDDFTVVVETEHVSELKETMKKDGLNVD